MGNTTPYVNRNKSEVKDILINNLSKEVTQIMANEVLQSNELLDMLIDMMFSHDHPTNWRAAWVIDHASEIDMNPIISHLPYFIKKLPHIKQNGIKRHITRMIARSGRIDLIDGNLINLCFDWLQSALTPIAVRAFCMDIIDMVSKKYPDIIPEFVLVLEEIVINGSTGEKNKSRKLIAKYGK